MNEIVIITNSVAPVYNNKALNTATQKVYKIGETVRKCAFETAMIIAAVEASECYKEDGFNSVHEWTEAAFGFKKSASYTLLKIGKEYVREIVNPKTNKVTGYASNLLPEDAEKDFTTTQIEKMLPAGHAFAVELVERGEVTPDMTCREIGKVIKSYLSEDEDSAENEGEDAEGNAPETNSDMVSMTVTENDVTIENGVDTWVIPLEVFNKYEVVTA